MLCEGGGRAIQERPTMNAVERTRPKLSRWTAACRGFCKLDSMVGGRAGEAAATLRAEDSRLAARWWCWRVAIERLGRHNRLRLGL